MPEALPPSLTGSALAGSGSVLEPAGWSHWTQGKFLAAFHRISPWYPPQNLATQIQYTATLLWLLWRAPCLLCATSGDQAPPYSIVACPAGQLVPGKAVKSSRWDVISKVTVTLFPSLPRSGPWKHSSEQLLTSTGTMFTNPTSQRDLITSDDTLFIVYHFHSLACLQLWGSNLTPHLALLICTDNFMSLLKQASISNTLEKRAFFRLSSKRKNVWALPCDITNTGLLLLSM